VRVNFTRPTPPAQPVDVAAVAPSRARAATLTGRGLAVSTRVSRASRITASLRLDPATARRLGVPRTIGTARRTVLRGGVYRVRVKTNRRGAAALRRAGSARVTLHVSAVAADGGKGSRSRTLAVRR
jgi:hypothetical protein